MTVNGVRFKRNRHDSYMAKLDGAVIHLDVVYRDPEIYRATVFHGGRMLWNCEGDKEDAARRAINWVRE